MKRLVLAAALALTAPLAAAHAQTGTQTGGQTGGQTTTSQASDVQASDVQASEVQATAPVVIEAAGPTPVLGVTPGQITAWLATQGVTPGPVEVDGDNSYVRVTDGPLTWILFFQSCQDGVCGDLQFSVGFASRAVTPDVVNGWNRDRRFLKAFYEPAATPEEPATAVVQYDLFLRPGAGPEQLVDHLAVWRGLAPEFARLVTRPATAPVATPPTITPPVS